MPLFILMYAVVFALEIIKMMLELTVSDYNVNARDGFMKTAWTLALMEAHVLHVTSNRKKKLLVNEKERCRDG